MLFVCKCMMYPCIIGFSLNAHALTMMMMMTLIMLVISKIIQIIKDFLQLDIEYRPADRLLRSPPPPHV